MIKNLPLQEEILRPKSTNPIEIVEYINSYIDKNFSENISVDISFMNIIDACYVSTLCATKHFTKFPKGKISWKISSDKVQIFNENFELGNSDYIL